MNVNQPQIQPVFKKKNRRRKLMRATMEEVFEVQITVEQLNKKNSLTKRKTKLFPSTDRYEPNMLYVSPKSNLKRDFQKRQQSNEDRGGSMVIQENPLLQSLSSIANSSSSFFTHFEQRKKPETQVTDANGNGPQVTYVNMHSMSEMNYQFIKYLEQNIYDTKTIELFKHLKTVSMVKKDNLFQAFRVSNKTGAERLIYQGQTKTKLKLIKKYCCSRPVEIEVVEKKIFFIHSKIDVLECNIRLEYQKEKRSMIKKLLFSRKSRTYRISLDNLNSNSKIGYIEVKGRQFTILSNHKRPLYELEVNIAGNITIRFSKSQTNADQILQKRSEDEINITFPNYLSWQEKVLIFSCITQILMRLY
ncbi:UNKNOWN [Stylonychia lemnae]|uniref:Uncharacterized protein n=1 Tax=Stylonychia lemnae TaxID=5949 RepID=A0A077ZV80_STYLE|nr:UNKNOWN [Stylonychia lemnae]|eukprot:CDW72311.1 UNKNOWN [Stylonychia lemnae]